MQLDFAPPLIRSERTRALALSVTLAAVIGLFDYFHLSGVSVGTLYVVPILIFAPFLNRWQIIAAAATAAFLREQFSGSAWNTGAAERVAMALLAFGGAGMWLSEIVRARLLEAENVKRLADETDLRREAEEDAQAILGSSPAAIITVSPDGCIDIANDSAKRLLGCDKSPAGRKISDFVPIVARLFNSHRHTSLLRTMVEGSGRRDNGEMFFAQMWLSTYETPAGKKLIAVVADASEQLRDREELGLRQLLMNSRIIAGAVSHEIRNLACAADVLYTSLGKSSKLRVKEDFVALGALLEAMRKLSSSEVPASSEQVLTGVDVKALMRELNIIVDSSAAGIEVRWEVGEDLSRVRADHSGLLQVFLNLIQNSIREVRGKPNAYITVAAYQLGSSVMIRVEDNGGGIKAPELLFHPFQSGSNASGLGLYVSRAIIRTYGGELQYSHRSGDEGCFVIELPAIVPAGAIAHD
jgi:two-component system, LuxR family, sensor kinase FixL